MIDVVSCDAPRGGKIGIWVGDDAREGLLLDGSSTVMRSGTHERLGASTRVGFGAGTGTGSGDLARRISRWEPVEEVDLGGGQRYL
jgi:hypothetical protein